MSRDSSARLRVRLRRLRFADVDETLASRSHTRNRRFLGTPEILQADVLGSVVVSVVLVATIPPVIALDPDDRSGR